MSQGRDRCIGAGMCVLLAPAVFGQAVQTCPAAVLKLLS